MPIGSAGAVGSASAGGNGCVAFVLGKDPLVPDNDGVPQRYAELC